MTFLRNKFRKILAVGILFVFSIVVIYGFFKLPIVQSVLYETGSVTGLGESWSSRNIERTKKRGDVIIKAIESYRKDHNELPKKLDNLKPDYIKLLPRPMVGKRKWTYHIYLVDTHEYYIQVESKYKNGGLFNPMYLRCISTNKKWYLQDDSF